MKAVLIIILVAVVVVVVVLLYGCGSIPSSKKEVLVYGPFSIERINKYGSRYDINTAERRDDSRSSYSIHFEQEVVDLPPSVTNNTGVAGLWKVYALPGAPIPSLLVGSRDLYLISAVNNSYSITPIVVGKSDFASIQWLDSENGQPGQRFEVYSSDDTDGPIELQGGSLLMVNDHVVLNLKSLEVYKIQKRDDWTMGYSANQVVSLSPDRNHIVFMATKYRAEKENAILVYNYKTNSVSTLPFYRDSMRLHEPYTADLEWFNTYFNWIKSDDGIDSLVIKEQDVTPPWLGYMSGGGAYSISPVKQEMVKVFYQFIQNTLGVNETDFHIDEYGNSKNYSFYFKGSRLEFKYLDRVQTVYLNEHILNEENNECDEKIEEIGNSFNSELAKGNFQEYFTSYKLNEN